MLLQSLIHVALLALSFCHGASAFYGFSGVQDNVNTMTGQRPKRLNIDTMAAGDPILFSLWVQALRAWQQDRTNLDGYLQIAGIHGRPYVAWDNVVGANGFSQSTGYCTHNSILFPTWHRPYLALFERRINAYAVAIASGVTGSNSAAWIAAAHNLRIPYWDWAKSPDIPASCSTRTITVVTPTGTMTIPNPLYQFNMTADFPSNLFPDRPPYPATVRSPDSGSLESNTARSNMALRAEPFKSYVYNVLSQDLSYTTFASYANGGPSIEAIHGNVHNDVGGQRGHMTQISYSAFDPIFWLHHTNCDRIFALWEAVWPNKWFPNNQLPPSKSSGTFTIKSGPGFYDESYEALTPFSRSSDGTPYTSDLSRTTRLFGYTYPELEDWGKTPAQLTADARAAINQLYGPTSLSKKLLMPKSRVARKVSADIPDEKQYYVSIAVSKYALPAGFVVSVFLGPPPADPTTWRYASNLAGSLPVFKPARPQDKSGNSNDNYLVHSEVPLDTALETAGYGSRGHAEVIQYLANGLCWRVQDLEGQVVDNERIGSLEVKVYDKDVELPDDESTFPKYGAPTYWPEVTRGKAGGY